MDFFVVLMFSFRNCKFSHDIPAYLAAKTHDIRVLESSEISDNAPFVKIDRPVRGQHMDHPSIDWSTTCPIFAETGECRFVRCVVCVNETHLLTNPLTTLQIRFQV